MFMGSGVRQRNSFADNVFESIIMKAFKKLRQVRKIARLLSRYVFPLASSAADDSFQFGCVMACGHMRHWGPIGLIGEIKDRQKE